MLRIMIYIAFLFVSNLLGAQELKQLVRQEVILDATYLQGTSRKQTVVLFISGSGPTDRDGNIVGAGKNNSLKYLAEGLQKAGYSSLRFDKRGIGKSTSENISIEKTTFQHYISDVEAWISELKKDHQKVIVLGHSLGALIGVKAIQKKGATACIALASIAKTMGETLRQQLGGQPPEIRDIALSLLDTVMTGKQPNNVPPYLMSLFSPQILPYLQSFIHIDIRKEVQDLNIPILVIQGTHDIQIHTDDAKQLASNCKNATYAEIAGMNHVLKEAPKERIPNFATYFDPELKLHPNLLPEILQFLEKTQD
ncbi:MAG: lysophospholipase [Flavobacteriaceae bacterium]|nr:lysophospholipase [Flavobacteriaceae bacterium]